MGAKPRLPPCAVPSRGLCTHGGYARDALAPAVLGSQRTKPRQHLCYVDASLSRLDFRGFPEKFIIVFKGVIGFHAAKKPTALMMHWWNGGRGGVCSVHTPRGQCKP